MSVIHVALWDLWLILYLRFYRIRVGLYVIFPHSVRIRCYGRTLGQSNLAEGEVARFFVDVINAMYSALSLKKPLMHYLLSYSPGGSTRCEVGPGWWICYPHIGGSGLSGGRRAQRCYCSKERWWFHSYRLFTVTITLSLNIRPQFAIKCLQHVNQKGCVNLGQNLGGRA